MNITAEEIVTDAMELSPALRAFVVEKLIESLDQSDSLPLSAQWKEEILRRCAEIDRDASQLRNADTVFKKPRFVDMKAVCLSYSYSESQPSEKIMVRVNTTKSDR